MFSVQGFCRGVKSIQNFDPNKPAKHVAGVATPKPNGFEGEEVIHELVLSKEQIAKGWAQKFNALRDQMVSVQFEIRHGVMNNKEWLNLNCMSEPKALTPAKASDKAA
jgi:hypothetical protein